MEYIIDGYNLIKCSYLKKLEGFSAEHARQALFHILAKYRGKHPAVKMTVVFDGLASPSVTNPPKGVHSVFSGTVSADDKIRKILETKKTGQPVTVVSDDRQVRMTARLLGKQFASTGDFLNLIDPLPKKETAKPAQGKSMSYRNLLRIEKELREFYEKRTERARTGKGSPPH